MALDIFELREENQRLDYRLKQEKAKRRKLQIQLAHRDKRIESMYRLLHKNGIVIPVVNESRAMKQLREKGVNNEDFIEQLADDHFGGKPNTGTINYSYEKGRHYGFQEALREYAI